MKPIIVIPPKLMSEADIKLLRDNDICVVESQDPAKLRFMDPIPSVSQRTQIDDAAIRLSRILLNGQWGHYTQNTSLYRNDFTRMFVDLLVKGTSLDMHGTQQEQEQQFFSQEKLNEISKIAREEARAEQKTKADAKKKENK